MYLHEYIKQQSVTKVAKLLDTNHSTVSNWLYLKATPSDIQKYRIVKLTHGLVTYAEIIEPVINHQIETGEISTKDLHV